jgi:hypothetical protein
MVCSNVRMRMSFCITSLLMLLMVGCSDMDPSSVDMQASEVLRPGGQLIGCACIASGNLLLVGRATATMSSLLLLVFEKLL